MIIGSIVLVTALGMAMIIWGVPYFFGTSLPAPVGGSSGSEMVPAQVTQIIDEGTLNLGGTNQNYQDLQVKILSGQYQGVTTQVTYGKDQIQPAGLHFGPGDDILITIGHGANNQLLGHYSDAMRVRPMLILLAVFVFALLAVTRWKGVRSLIALAFSFLMIIGYVIPHILGGEDPVKVSIIGSMILLVVTLYVTYGWNLKTHASVLSILIVLAVTGIFAWLFIKVAFLTGNGDESALYLVQVPGIKVDLRGLLLGGMIIGALGVLDDLVITQASAVFELHSANPAAALRELFHQAYRIGQDHVASTVNTLVMAYTGVALPMLLLFTVESGNFSQLINLASVAEEIVRTLVGSLGLISAVPISTIIASLLAVYSLRLGILRPFLGSEAGSDLHEHPIPPAAE